MTRTVSTHAYRLSAEGFDRVQKELAKLGKDGDRAFGQLERATTPAIGKLGAFGRAADGLAARAVPRLIGALGALASGFAIGRVAAFGDALINLRSRIALFTEGAEQAAAAEERLIAIAQATGGDLGGLGELFARIAPAKDELGATDAQLLRLTESLQKLAIVSGAAPQEASAAFRQLAQGLAAGALRGDEFNSVAEQMPAVMRLIADELGVTTGKLRELAADGEITADVVLRALLKRSEEIDAQFEAMGATVGRSGQRVANAFRVALGDAAAHSGLIDALAGSFDRLAEVLASPSFRAAASAVFTALAGAIETASMAVGVLLDHVDLLSGALAGALAGRAVVAAVAALGSLGGAMGALTAASGVATAALVGLRAALAAVFGPAGLAIAAGAALGALATQWGEVETAQDRANRVIEESADLHDALTRSTERLGEAQKTRVAEHIDALIVEITAQQEIARQAAALTTQSEIYGHEATDAAIRARAEERIRDTERTIAGLERRLDAIRALRDRVLERDDDVGERGGALRADESGATDRVAKRPSSAEPRASARSVADRAREAGRALAEQAREIVAAIQPARNAVAEYEAQIAALEAAHARGLVAGDAYRVALGLLDEAREEATTGGVSASLERDELAYVRLRQEIEATGTSVLGAARAQDVLNAALAAGHVDAEAFARLAGALAEAGEESGEAIDAFARSAAEGLAKLALDADASISDMLASFARLKAEQLLTGSLETLLTAGLTAGLSAGASALSGAFGGGGASFLSALVKHDGGVVGREDGPRRSLPAALFAGAPRLHSGYLAADEVPAILQRGESVLTPAQMRALGPAAPPQISIVVNNSSSAQASARSEPDGRGGARIEIDVIDALADRAGERLATGPLGRRLGFGASRAVRRA